MAVITAVTRQHASWRLTHSGFTQPPADSQSVVRTAFYMQQHGSARCCSGSHALLWMPHSIAPAGAYPWSLAYGCDKCLPETFHSRRPYGPHSVTTPSSQLRRAATVMSGADHQLADVAGWFIDAFTAQREAAQTREALKHTDDA